MTNEDESTAKGPALEESGHASADVGCATADGTNLQQELAEQLRAERLHSGFSIGRRDFARLAGVGAMALLGSAKAAAGPQESGGRRFGFERHPLPRDIASWIHVDADGSVTVFTGKAEVGQNIRTSLAQQVAEELRVPFASVQMVMADTARTPWDMGTFGSRTTPTMGPQLRNAAASARAALVELAARRWGVEPQALGAADGKVLDAARNRSVTYAELAEGQDLANVSDPPLTPASDWKVAGHPVAKADAREFVTGGHRYPADIVRPGVVYGKVLRPPAFHATLVEFDGSAAAAMPGVKVVRDGDFAGVTAADETSAERALQAIKARWNAPPQIAGADLFSHLRSTAQAGDGSRQAAGDTARGRGQSAHELSATYTVAYIAHVPLEPRAAVAEWNSESQGPLLTVWTGSQRPFGVQDELASAFHIPAARVRVIVPDTGSAYGGKHTGECAVEAARLARAAGKPVRLVWTREEEFTWAYFRPAGVIDVAGGVDASGHLSYWECDNYNSGPSAMDTPYEVANRRAQFHECDAPLRQGSYRALAATANHFARESHMDDLAHAAGLDPLEFRRRNITDPRLRDVFEAAAKSFGWTTSRRSETAGELRGIGLAGGFEKGGYVATCAEVAVDRADGRVRVVRATEAFDCGPVVNPNGLRNQIAGAISMGIGGALFEAIRFDNGRILNPHLAQYPVPRFRDMPRIEVVLVDRKNERPMGAGETPIVGIAPAIGNAIFAATGVRLRALPMVPHGKLAV